MPALICGSRMFENHREALILTARIFGLLDCNDSLIGSLSERLRLFGAIL